jgi:AraC-like DNA-binding protein/ligand-binding sensor protein
MCKEQRPADSFLHKAHKLLSAYSRATGTVVCLLDSNYQYVPESYDEVDPDKHICLFCEKCNACKTTDDPNADPKGGSKVDSKDDSVDHANHPCNEMHINAIRESHRCGGSYIYMCDLGFIFWTSPLFFDDIFTGALVGSGFLGIDGGETVAQMQLLGKGSVEKPELRKAIAHFPRGDSKKIQALADLMLICAESLSTGKGAYHRALRRRAEQQEIISAKILELKNNYPPGGSGPGYPFDREQALLSCIRSGDTGSCKRILNEFLAVLFFLSSDQPNQYEDLQCRAVELVILISRTAISPGTDMRELLEISDNFLSRVLKTTDTVELVSLLHIVVEYYAGRASLFRGIQHASVMKKAKWYIRKNFTLKLSLQDVAGVSGLSAPYFSTIFKDEMGENFSSYLNRLRVEKAGELLSATDLSLCEIAKACGFDDQSWFSKTFKLYTGVTPGRYRNRSKASAGETENIVFSENYRNVIGKKQMEQGALPGKTDRRIPGCVAGEGACPAGGFPGHGGEGAEIL